MKCREAELLLQLSIDGEITGNERALLEAHLDDCVVCRRREAWLDFIEEQLADVLGPSVPDSEQLADEVLNAVLLKKERQDKLPVVSDSEEKKGRTANHRKRKRKMLTQLARALWKRTGRKKAKQEVKRESVRGGWLDASVSALQPRPVSLEGFRAVRQGMSAAVRGPASALKLVAGALPGKDKS